MEDRFQPPVSLHVQPEVYVCIRETGQVVTITEARDRYRKSRWSVPVKNPTDPIRFLG